MRAVTQAPQRAGQAQRRALPSGFHFPPDPDRDSGYEPVAKCGRFLEASRSAPRVLAARGGDQFFKVAICNLKDRPRPQS
jgi:hypothetical protein